MCRSGGVQACELVGFKKNEAAEKCKRWSKKRNVGILAKMLIGIHKERGRTRALGRDECEALFKKILLDKFTRNAEARKVLLGTGDAYLCEFVRSSRKRFEKHGQVERWGGMIVDGKVIGENQTGALMMWVRSRLRMANTDGSDDVDGAGPNSFV